MKRAPFRWLVALNVVLVVLWFVLGPVRGGPPAESAQPVVTYNEALRRIDRLRAAEDSTIMDLLEGTASPAP